MDGLDEAVLFIGIVITSVAVGAGIAEFSLPIEHQYIAIGGVIMIALGIVISFLDI